MVNSSVKRSIGVHVTAGFLHFLVNAAAGARRRAFEEHVFEHVREAGTEPATFVDAARRAPRLRGHDGRAVVFAHDDDEAVFERGEFDAGRLRRDYGCIFCHFKMCRTGRVFGNAIWAIQFGAAIKLTRTIAMKYFAPRKSPRRVRRFDAIAESSSNPAAASPG